MELRDMIIGFGVFLIITIKPVISAYAKALERKADKLYREQPSEIPHEERKQRAVKALSTSMIGIAVPDTHLQKYMPNEKEGNRISSLPKPTR